MLDCRDAAYIDGNEVLDGPYPTLLRSLFRDFSSTTPASSPQRLHPNGPSFLLSDDPSDFLLVIGVSHTNVGKATYSNLVVYNVPKEMGVLDVSDRALNNSAVEYLPGEPLTTSSLFYVWKFARACGAEEKHYCSVVPTEFPGVPLYTQLTFVERAYMQRETAVGPDVNTLLPPVILHYNHRRTTASLVDVRD